MTTDSEHVRQSGLPLWMPLLGLLIAFIFAVIVGIRICPTLTALVYPPELSLPAGDIVVLKQESKGNGQDEKLYGTKLDGCRIAQYYKGILRDCFYDINNPCGGNGVSSGSSSYPVATCRGPQATGDYRVYWTVIIDSGYPDKQYPTKFRVIREVTNTN